MFGQLPNQISFVQVLNDKLSNMFLNLLQETISRRGKGRTRRSLLAAAFVFLISLNAKADYTIPAGSNTDASTLTGQSGVLTINGTLTVSSNVNLSGFTSVIINAPYGKIYWSNNSDLTFPAGTTLTIQSGAPGLQSSGNNSSQRLIIGSTIIAVSNNNSNAASFDFTQVNSLGGLPQYTTSNTNNVCQGSAITASVTPQIVIAGVSYSYAWSISPSSGTFSYNSDHSTATISPAAGTYTLTCVASANTYQTTFNMSLTIKPVVTPVPTSNTPVCAGSAINLSTPLVSGATYSWSGPNGFTSTSRTPSISGAASVNGGVYSVVATSSQGCVSSAVTTPVTINPLPATPSVSGNGPVCAGSSINLSTAPVTGATYSWTGPNGFTSSSRIPSISNATTAMAGTYSVVVTSSGCNSIAGTTNFIVNSLPAAPSVTANTPLCTGSTLNLSTPNTAGYSYAWSGPNGFSSTSRASNITNVTSGATGTYTLTATSADGCVSPASTIGVTVNPSYTWFGTDVNWSDASNWCPQVPVSTYDITIPATANNPVIQDGTVAAVNNITIASGATLTVNGTLQVKGTITNNGTLDITNGTLEMNGTSAQSIAGSMFYNKTVKNLIASNAAGLSVSSTPGDTLKISGGLTFGTSNATLNTGDNIDFLSTADGTAYLGAAGASNTISGKAIVDRYLNLGTGSGQHTKAWEFLSFPTAGSTVKQSVMENGNNTPGYGTWLTGPGGTANGFDASSGGYALKAYNSSSNDWAGISNTNNQINNTSGYMVFVRGDRTVNGTTVTTPKPTILRSKGTLNTGSQPAIAVSPDQYQSIGNPYPAPIDFTKLTRLNGVDDKFYAWDPYMYGVYGYGGYQTLSATNGWVPVPGGTVAYPSGVADSTIRSGQAFFVHATAIASLVAQTPTISIDESSKTTSSRNINFARIARRTTSTQRQFLRTTLLMSPAASAPVADGNAVAFDAAFSNKVDGDDALKLANSGENFGIKSSGKILAVEARSPISINDTIVFNMSSMRWQSYLLQIVPVNMQSETLQPYLLDSYLNTSTALSLSDTNRVTFSVTSTAASSTPNRFSIVFREMAALPVTLTSVEATPGKNEVIVGWNTRNENGMLQYEVQKSTDGTLFATSGITPALNDGTTNYQWADTQLTQGINYYRIKMVSKDGKVSYSQVVKVNTGKISPVLAVAPNPVINGTIHLIFKNEPAGKYDITLSNQVGQVVLSKSILHSSMSAFENISDNSITNGVYNLSITTPDGSTEVMKIIVK
jgi:hypothetical protein